MTESTKYPKPIGLELDALSDAAWDLRDCDEAFIHDSTDSGKWLYWLRRYEGFAEDEIRAEIIKSPVGNPAIHITVKD